MAQMRPNPRWQQQGGRGQGERRELREDALFNTDTFFLGITLF